jgi:hypothetical protein
MLMAVFDHRPALNVYAINRDKVSVVDERLRETVGFLCIPALGKLRDQLLYSVSIGTLNSGQGPLLFYSDGQNSCARVSCVTIIAACSSRYIT